MKMATQAVSSNLLSPADRTNKLCKKASQLLKKTKEGCVPPTKKELNTLIQKIDAEFRQYPPTARLLSLQGKLLDATGNHRMAIQKHSTAAMLSPDEWVFRYRLVESLLADTQYEECIRLCRTIPADTPYWGHQTVALLQKLPAEYSANSREREAPAALNFLPEDKQDINTDEVEFQIVEAANNTAPVPEAKRTTSSAQDSTWSFTRLFKALLPERKTQPQTAVENRSGNSYATPYSS